ncbi:hotdog fold domain-containing protein [Noviherbaspirillum sp. CPCC 100848]|uniref:Hotdog fold domain-containing protein n=1 Tax=Noviherbaspirillum album TaxID=3080276 RepID=A0ABU6J7M7_9BURK|nr:hotdog fold domain-containing protein [Noviherbaspirillum sp. CPCC 100848]MEC4719647.1 hotdog fold domain-containing protein [Noviherbaspirillum sp. CPCC 100848]
MNSTLALYQQMGNEVFSKAVTQVAPYFSTITPDFTALRPGFAEVRFANRREVHNHIGTVHAIALCNAAELAAGTMTTVSIAEGREWIPVGMNVQYLAKAKTDMRVVADGSGVDWSHAGNVEVPVDAFDTEGRRVFTATITMNLR